MKITHIDMVDGSDSDMLITLEGGIQLLIHHDQDCCEHVYYTGGDSHAILLNRDVLDIRVESSTLEKNGDWDSATENLVYFELSDGVEVLRWIGESNGYYSETIDIEDVTNQANVDSWKREAPFHLLPDGWPIFDYKVHKWSEYWLILSDYWTEHGDDGKSLSCRIRSQR